MGTEALEPKQQLLSRSPTYEGHHTFQPKPVGPRYRVVTRASHPTASCQRNSTSIKTRTCRTARAHHRSPWPGSFTPGSPINGATSDETRGSKRHARGNTQQCPPATDPRRAVTAPPALPTRILAIINTTPRRRRPVTFSRAQEKITSTTTPRAQAQDAGAVPEHPPAFRGSAAVLRGGSLGSTPACVSVPGGPPPFPFVPGLAACRGPGWGPRRVLCLRSAHWGTREWGKRILEGGEGRGWSAHGSDREVEIRKMATHTQPWESLKKGPQEHEAICRGTGTDPR